MKYKSTKLFLFKYLTKGNIPENTCQFYIGSILGLIVFILSPIMGILIMIRKEYENSWFANIVLNAVTIIVIFALGGITHAITGWNIIVCCLVGVIVVMLIFAIVIGGSIGIFTFGEWLTNPQKDSKYCKKINYHE